MKQTEEECADATATLTAPFRATGLPDLIKSLLLTQSITCDSLGLAGAATYKRRRRASWPTIIWINVPRLLRFGRWLGK